MSQVLSIFNGKSVEVKNSTSTSFTLSIVDTYNNRTEIIITGNGLQLLGGN